MKRCPKCTTQNTTTSIYCEFCGANLDISLTNVDWFDPTATSARNIPPPPPPSALNPYPTTEFSDPYLTPDTINPYPTTDTINPYSTIVDLDQHNFAAKSQVPTSGKGFIHVINILLSSILYLIGTVCIAFSFVGIFEYINDTLAGLCFFFSTLINIAILVGILIIILRRARSPRLRWWQRLLWIGAAFAGSFIVFIIIEIAITLTMPVNFVLSDTLTSQTLGLAFLLCGIAIEFIAFR